jgi:hypothetical protein
VARQRVLVVMVQEPGNGFCAGIQTGSEQVLAKSEDQIQWWSLRSRPRDLFGRRERSAKRGIAFRLGPQLVDPFALNAIAASEPRGRLAARHEQGGDDPRRRPGD